MNKKIIAAVLAASSVMSLTAGVMAEDAIKIFVNGKQVICEDLDPFIENDHTLVPMRAIFEALGASVDWDGDTRTVVSYDPVSDVSITLQIDSDTMFVGETPVTLETPARIANDVTVVPVRAIAEGMHSVVGWDGDTRTVTVEKEVTVEQPPQIANPWAEYASLDELNAALNTAEGYKYSVVELTTAGYTATAYRYLAETNMAEIKYASKDGKTEVTVRTQPGDTDISGITGGVKVEEYTIDNSLVEIYTYEDITYAVWSCEDGTIISNSVAVKSADMKADDAKALVKTLVEDVETNHPRG